MNGSRTSAVAPGHPEERPRYSLSAGLAAVRHSHPPGTQFSSSSGARLLPLLGPERSEPALCGGKTCSGIHWWTQHAQQPEKEGGTKECKGLFFFPPFFSLSLSTAVQLVSKFTWGLHSTVRKVPTRHKDGDKVSVGILLSPELLLHSHNKEGKKKKSSLK